MEKISTKTRLEVREKPNETPVMHQEWRELLFLHWEYDPEEIQKTLPPGLFVDTFQGKGYVTITPLLMNGFSVANLPAIPGLDFIEVNFRTYVYDENGIPGLWFYSLDLNSIVGANLGRRLFSLPYFYAELKQIDSASERVLEGKRVEKPEVKMKFAYRAHDQNVHFAKEDTLEFFLIERYVMFTFAANQLYFGRVHHAPYPLQIAEVTENQHTFWKAYGFGLHNQEPAHVHLSRGVSVDVFSQKKVVVYKE